MRRLPAHILPALLLCLGASVASAQEPGSAPVADSDEPDPPVLGAAPRPAPNETPSPAFMAEIYAAARYGGRLYDQRRYAESLPYLLAAAEHGFKLAQASAGDIYLHGRGGVERNVLVGIGWLGVAAAPATSLRIADYFENVRAQLPDAHKGNAERVVEEFRARYGHARHRVECRVFGNVVQDIGCRFRDDPEADPLFEQRQRPHSDVEEVVVTAPIIDTPAPEIGEVPSGQFIAEVYDAANRGSALYNEGKYKEALPFLVAAARRGFKWAQASAADIYLNGRGGVAPDLEAGIGWLGVAAQPRTAGSISRYFKDSMARLPDRYTPEVVQTIVADYSDRYGNNQHRVACRFESDEGRTWSLYFKRLQCRFIDEATQCRNLVFDGTEVNSQWTCEPLRGTRAVDARPY